MYWITGRKSKLSLTNILLIYKIILKPIWTYGVPLWGTASQSNIEILQRLQNRILRMATNAPRYVPNHVLHADLQMPTIREEITQLSSNYKATLFVLLGLIHSTHAAGPPYWLSDCSTHIFLLAWLPSDRLHVMSFHGCDRRHTSRLTNSLVPTLHHHRIILLRCPVPPLHRLRLVLI